jgi:hypothetical protein
MRPADITAALRAYTEATKGNTVDAAEFNRRISICKACPKLKRVSGLTGRVSQILGSLSIKHKVPRDVSGSSCGVCGCSLLLLVPALPQNLHKDSPDEAKKRPATCWLKTSLTPPA